MFYRGLLLLMMMSAVQAAEPAATGYPSTSEVTAFGNDTRAWLDLQRSGQAAAPVRPQSGVVASRVYRRYLNSFDHPIPMFFERGTDKMSAQ